MWHAKLQIENVSLMYAVVSKVSSPHGHAPLRCEIKTSVRQNSNNKNIRQQQQQQQQRLITTTMQMDSCTQNAPLERRAHYKLINGKK